MWLEAIFSQHDLEQALRAITPATLTLGAHGSVSLETPTRVELVAGRGLRAVCPATVRATVARVEVPLRVASATLLLEPSIAERGGREVVIFKVTLESIDVTALPHVLEAAAVDAINAALIRQETELVWDFRDTLSHRFTLPDIITSLHSLDVIAAWGKVRITEEALVFAVSIHAVDTASAALGPLAEAPAT
jgi:hypothetical protein